MSPLNLHRIAANTDGVHPMQALLDLGHGQMMRCGVILMLPTGSVVSCYENEIPTFVEVELDRLYGARYSSMAHFRVYGGAENANTYVFTINGTPAALFLFRWQGRDIHVINEGMKVSTEDVQRFADYIFARYRKAMTITFHAVETDKEKPAGPYPRQYVECEEDTVMRPAGPSEAYITSLGKSTRRNIMRHANMLKRSFPSFDYRFYEKEQVSEQHIRELIGFNHARLSRKNRTPMVDERETQRIISMVRQCGFVGIATIDGRVCGGQITYRLGRNFAFRMLTHDPAYDDYRLGSVLYFLTICECIERGAGQINLGWGQDEYKYQFGGVRRSLDHLVVYRSLASFLLNGKTAMRTALNGQLLQTKRWILDADRRTDGMALPVVRMLVSGVRWARRSRART